MMRDEQKAEWSEIVEHLRRGTTRTVTGVPWSRDNVVKLYQTAKAKMRSKIGEAALACEDHLREEGWEEAPERPKSAR